MSQDKPSWMDEEEGRAEELNQKGQTANHTAPQLVRERKRQAAPPRMQKALFIQEKYAQAFDDLVHKRKKIKGKKAPELAEEAILLLLKKYGEDYKNL